MLSRPTLSREIIRYLAKLFEAEALGDRPHDRAVAIPTMVVVQFFIEIIRLLTPDDRSGFWVDWYAVLTVARGAELHLGLDVVSGVRGY